jgi:hypothetical protein
MNEHDKATLGLSIYSILANHAHEGREVAFIPFSFLGLAYNMGYTLTEDEIKNILEYMVSKGFVKPVPFFGYGAVSNQPYGPSGTADPWDWIKV